MYCVRLSTRVSRRDRTTHYQCLADLVCDMLRFDFNCGICQGSGRIVRPSTELTNNVALVDIRVQVPTTDVVEHNTYMATFESRNQHARLTSRLTDAKAGVHEGLLQLANIPVPQPLEDIHFGLQMLPH